MAALLALTFTAAFAPQLPSESPGSASISRRSVLLSPLVLSPLVAATAASAAPLSEGDILKELRSVQTALEPLPGLIDEEKWDAVRTVLKTPPVGNIWNLGESKNILRKLADLRDDVELFEVADEVAGALQLTDQFVYDNNFIYFQPGNGKVKTKEPKQSLAVARSKLQAVLDAK
jgi:hypothetical protein